MACPVGRFLVYLMYGHAFGGSSLNASPKYRTAEESPTTLQFCLTSGMETRGVRIHAFPSPPRLTKNQKQIKWPAAVGELSSAISTKLVRGQGGVIPCWARSSA